MVSPASADRDSRGWRAAVLRRAIRPPAFHNPAWLGRARQAASLIGPLLAGTIGDVGDGVVGQALETARAEVSSILVASTEPNSTAVIATLEVTWRSPQ